MEAFLHPWYMAAAGALVSAPILIHLINRMRFKRVRWAAMEFLLKSQKRNRRRLIIEQLLLLALRCFLVLLAGFLVARYIQAGLNVGQGAVHVVVLDDTLSMSDHWNEKGELTSAFEQVKNEIKKVAKEAALASSAQQLRLVLLSDLETVRFDQRLNDTALNDLDAALRDLQPTALHLPMSPALAKARDLFNESPQANKILHLASDFRERDWDTGPEAEKLGEELDRLTGEGVNVSLLDAAHPFRGSTRDVALNHDNLAIRELRAESRIAAEGVPVEFVIRLVNHSASDKSTFLRVRVDGQENFEASGPIERVPPFEEAEHRFTLTFQKKRSSGPLPAGASREERERRYRAEQEFVHIAAEINAEETGVARDNARDLVLEVRRKVPTLVLDGNGPAGRLPGGDQFHIEEAFFAARSYEPDFRSVDDLEKIDLDLYPSIFLLNVPQIRSEKAIENLRAYVQRGGNIAFFLGERVQPAFYNDVLHKKYEGLFPILIASRPGDPPTEQDRDDRKWNDPQPKLLFPNPRHPLVAALADPKLASIYRYLSIDRWFPAQPRFQWEPIAQEKAETLIALPNQRSMDDYKARAQELINQSVERVRELAGEDPSLEKYAAAIESNYRRQVINALGTPYLFNLVVAFDNLLNDLGLESDPKRPRMTDLWAYPDMASLKAQIQSFRDTVLYGDPLVVAMPYGRGRVVACLTSAGTNSAVGTTGTNKWNEWGTGSPASWTYPIFMMDLQRFLTSESEGLSRLVGEELTFTLEAARYEPKVRRRFWPQPEPGVRDNRTEPVDQGEQSLAQTGDELQLRVSDTRRPGVYTFDFYPIVEGAVDPQMESQSFALNVDTIAESDLKRVSRERVERGRSGTDARGGKIVLRSPGDSYEAFKSKVPDASESPWLYLIFLIVLVVEQALAVHLSFHLKGNEGTLPAAAGRPSPAPA